MALLKYFTRVNSTSGTVLSNPESSLNRVVNRKAIETANEEVTKIHSEGKGAKQQSPYHKATPAQKALVGKYAAEHRVMNSIRRFQRFHLRCIEGKHMQSVDGGMNICAT